MSTTTNLPEIVSRAEWTAARTALLEREKELTRARDALHADRRRLPMVEITKDYRFDGPDGPVGLRELFDGRRQLMVGHFMFDPSWDAGCGSCTAGAEELSAGLYAHLHIRDTTLVHVSRAPLVKIDAYKASKGRHRGCARDRQPVPDGSRRADEAELRHGYVVGDVGRL